MTSSLLDMIDSTIDFVSKYPQTLLAEIKVSNASNTKLENEQILHLLKLAFPTEEESKLVAALMRNGTLVDSMVITHTINEQAHVIGHVATTPVHYQYENERHNGLCLAPLAIHPQYQRHGIGSKLMHALLAKYRQNAASKYCYMTVCGDPKYYNRFAFESAYRYGLKCKWEAYPIDAFQIQIFQKANFVQPVIPADGELILVHHAVEFDECT
eukprot:CAMPEP_0197021666 /NCGR_PEP_ID=MMETSP1384-20130603/2607_1 /TAXON_ID=29189 /ORGANISM="Ammonia sp." /LENGTH=212 /DNA_ID=CAMNT_0042449549 /DNA_START=12 /DNA_END=650 /DNA_ORIENTATION=+